MIPAAGAALAYGTAVALHGSGFIAAFVAGLVFRAVIKRDPEDTNRLTEEVGGVLNGVTFILFGAILLGPALGELSWELALYAVLSLTVVRMVPVAIGMLGSHARGPTVGFLGWFGPRGLASIVFALIVIEESQLPHEHLIVLAVYLTVGLSVFAHGLTAAPLANRYAHRGKNTPPAAGHPKGSAPREGTPTRGLMQNSSAGQQRATTTTPPGGRGGTHTEGAPPRAPQAEGPRRPGGRGGTAPPPGPPTPPPRRAARGVAAGAQQRTIRWSDMPEARFGSGLSDSRGDWI